MTQNLAAIVKQELKDFKDEALSDLKEIKSEMSGARDDIANLKQELAVIRQKEIACKDNLQSQISSIKKEKEKECQNKNFSKEWTLKKATVVLAIVTILLNIGLHFIH